MKKIILIINLIILLQAFGAGALNNYYSGDFSKIYDPSNEECCYLDKPFKILFIGSSYFNYNNLPDLFENLALSSGKEVYVDHHGRNGLYLSDHASRSATESKINEQDWDYVVLQGVGTNTAYPDYFTDHPVYPALETLRDKIHQNCESTKMVFCMPWAFEDGMTWYQDWTDTYEDMQLKIFETTLNYSKDIGFIIAPVGWAWYTVLEEQEYPLHYLHMSDWNHPSLKGSYLMSCVIFSTLFQENSVGLSYYGGLLEEEANYFQTVASHTVLDNLSLWNILDEDNNNPPDTPDSPSGPIKGKPGEEYIYTTTTNDLNNDQVYYLFDWGDGNDSSWLGPSNSGETYETTYSWNEQGSYEIKVKAMDEHGLESDWSDPLVVSMPKNNYFDRFYSMSKKLSDTFSILNFFRGKMK